MKNEKNTSDFIKKVDSRIKSAKKTENMNDAAKQFANIEDDIKSKIEELKAKLNN